MYKEKKTYHTRAIRYISLVLGSVNALEIQLDDCIYKPSKYQRKTKKPNQTVHQNVTLGRLSFKKAMLDALNLNARAYLTSPLNIKQCHIRSPQAIYRTVACCER